MLWIVVGACALVGFWLGRISVHPARSAREELEARSIIENLKAANALLRTLTSSPDITHSLFELALRIRAIVPCDRVGLALLTEDREGYSTYTARLDESGPPQEARVDLHFPRNTTVIEQVVAAREGRVIDDLDALAPAFLDANVLKTSGFASAALVPLVFEGDAFGTLNLVARRPGAFSQTDLHTLKPVAEALASAYGTRRLAHALARHEMANELSELTFAFANDMSGAVQAIIGQCELLATEYRYREPMIDRDLQTMLQQARRLRDILNQMQRMTREHASPPPRQQ